MYKIKLLPICKFLLTKTQISIIISTVDVRTSNHIHIIERKLLIMKKALKVLSAAMLSAVVAVSAAASVSAAGINANEQKILDALNGTVNLNGVDTKIPASYVGQAESYFNTVEITESEANTVIEKINAVKAYLESTGVSSFSELNADQISKVVALANEASGVVGVTVSFSKDAGFSYKSSSSNGGSSNGGSGSTGTIGGDVIKTTGFSVADVTVVAGLGIVLVTAAGVYLLKTSKKESLDA